jgi:hypothetical protein
MKSISTASQLWYIRYIFQATLNSLKTPVRSKQSPRVLPSGMRKFQALLMVLLVFWSVIPTLQQILITREASAPEGGVECELQVYYCNVFQPPFPGSSHSSLAAIYGRKGNRQKSKDWGHRIITLQSSHSTFPLNLSLFKRWMKPHRS